MKKFVKNPINATTIPILQRRLFTPEDVAALLHQIKQLHGYSVGVSELPEGNGVEFQIDDDYYAVVMNK